MKCQEKNDIYFMKVALDQAKIAKKKGEVPIGAVVVLNNEIIAKAYNKREILNQISAHAEICAIQKAARKLKSWKLDNCILYTNLEPCPMCMSAAIQSRIKKIVFSCSRKVENDTILIEKTSGVLQNESLELINSFFEELRSE